jgi:hypothetical protein
MTISLPPLCWERSERLRSCTPALVLDATTGRIVGVTGRKPLFLLIVMMLCLSGNLCAQSASGIISPARSANWSQAGIPGGIPSGSWTQCGATVSAYNGSASTITTLLASCSANQYVLLGPGTFNLTGQIAFPTKGHVVLRGSGANSTFVVIGSSGGVGCQLGTSFICAQSSDGTYFNEPPPTIYSWTGGYSQGSTSITLSGTSNINATNPTILFLEQCETGLTASSATTPCTGSQADNNQLFVCSGLYGAGGGCSSNGPGNGNTGRGQLEMTVATAVNSSTGVVTIADPLKYPNWTFGQTPRVWIAQPIVQVGVENLAIDDVSNGANDVIQFFNAYQWWVSGVKITNWGRWGVEALQTLHGIVQNSYFYHSTGSDSYAIRFEGTSNSVIQNNIIQQVFAPLVFDGPSSGDVIAYNFVLNDNYQSDFMRGSFFEHAVNGFDLYEGNIATQQNSDGNHGTANMLTRYRNFFPGWDSCANGQCGSSTAKDSSTNAVIENYGSRYSNNIANVYGTGGYHTAYQSMNSNVSVLAMGVGNGGAATPVPSDPLSYSTSLFWGNYDSFKSTVRWCGNSSDTGWSATCSGVSEVPVGASTYPNSIPTLGDTGAGQGALPPSLYLSSKPPWFGSIPWPSIGPDVTSGNVGQCSGTLNTPGKYAGMAATNSGQCAGASLSASWGGHVNAIPAMSCALNILGMPADGTGAALAFDAGTCYSGTGSGGSPVAPPTSLTLSVH